MYEVIKEFIDECFIKIHSNSNFENITGANITVINEDSEINSISKVTTLDDLIKECKSFLQRIQKFDNNTEKRKQERDKLNYVTKLLETSENG